MKQVLRLTPEEWGAILDSRPVTLSSGDVLSIDPNDFEPPESYEDVLLGLVGQTAKYVLWIPEWRAIDPCTLH